LETFARNKENIKRMTGIGSSFLIDCRTSFHDCKKASNPALPSIIGSVKRTGLIRFPDVEAPFASVD
jgi:hypothetical protein